MGQTMQLPPPTSSKGYWELTGHLYVVKNPDSNIGAEYVLFDGPGTRGQEINMDIRFSGPDSPFTYSGSVWLGPGPPSDDGSQFKIEGKGVKVNGSSEPERESTFKIVAGSGKGLYSGISGGGKLVVLIGGPFTKVYGNCVFRNMNSVGAALM